MNNLILIVIILCLPFINGTDTKIATESKMLIEETVKVETEVKQEELKEDEIQLLINSEISDELKAKGFEFSVDGYEIYNHGALIYYSHSVNKESIKDIKGIQVQMNWELEDGRTGQWGKSVYTKSNHVSYEEQSKTTFPILTEITDLSELNNLRLHFVVR